MIASADLHMGGYEGDRMPQMQRRMIDSISAIPGVTASGYITRPPLSVGSGDSFVYTDTTVDFRPTNFAADAMTYSISSGYMQAAGTRLLAGRDLAFSDDKGAPTAALVNRTFAIKVFGSLQKAVGGHFKYWSGKRAEVVGVVEDGKYRTLTEDQMPAMFFSFLQQPQSDTTLVVRSARPPQELAAALQRNLGALDPSLPLAVRPWNAELDWALFSARIATIALGILGVLGAMLAVTGIFGMASYVVSKRLRELGIRVALGAGRKQILGASLGRAFRLLAIGSAAGIVLGLLASRVLAFIVYQATPKDPLVLGGVTLAMLLLGLLAALLPARRALAFDPLILLRDE
jgi:ABC-type antimicrobial peptide transport system permease subunit